MDSTTNDEMETPSSSSSPPPNLLPFTCPSSLVICQLSDDDDEQIENQELSLLSHPPNKSPITKARPRKQQITPIFQEDEDPVTFKVIKPVPKPKQVPNRRRRRPTPARTVQKLYEMNPEDYVDDPEKRAQIMRAKATHVNRKKRQDQFIFLENEVTRLKCVIGCYKEREKRVRGLCKCEAVSNMLQCGAHGKGKDIKSCCYLLAPGTVRTKEIIPPLKTYARRATPGPLRNPKSIPDKEGVKAPESLPAPPSPKANPERRHAATVSTINSIITKMRNSSQYKVVPEATATSNCEFNGMPKLVKYSEASPDITQGRSKPPKLRPAISPSSPPNPTPQKVLVIQKGANGNRLVKVPPSVLSTYFANKNNNAQPKIGRTFSRAVSKRISQTPLPPPIPMDIELDNIDYGTLELQYANPRDYCTNI